MATKSYCSDPPGVFEPVTLSSFKVLSHKGSDLCDDVAFDDDDEEEEEEITAAQEKKIWRRIDLRLVPIITVIYLFSFMDRANIGNAKLDGLMTQLKLTGDKYNMALTAFMIPYSLFGFPSNLVLPLIRPSMWIPLLMFLWGTTMTLMGIAKTYPQLVAARVCLGVAEAGFYPGVAYYISMWYPKYMYQYRIALFSGAATLAGAFSGLLAYGINFMNGIGKLEGWSWIFILEGLATVIVAFVAAIVMVDYPSTAKFLTAKERSFITRKRVQHVGQDEEHHRSAQIWEAFTDWQVWGMSLIGLSFTVPLYGITFFLPTIIHNFGYNVSISQLLSIPPYVLATIFLLTFAHFSDKLQRRFPFILASQFTSMTGYLINISNAGHGVKYFGTYLCVIGCYAGLPGPVSWLANNLGGRYKRAVGLAMLVGIGNVGGVVACNIFRAQDGPRFLLGHGLEIVFIGIGILTVPLMVLTYEQVNAQRNLAQSTQGVMDGLHREEMEPIGDRKVGFRYTI